MFGLSRPDLGANHMHLYQIHRKHYCGTCKTIGKNYGHKARLFLNFDAVFLAEILSLLDGDDTQSWSKAHQAINQCWVMPKKAEQSPFALEYAAAINVLLAELKVLDNIQDSQKWRWSVLQRIFSKSFRKVQAQFKEWSVDLDYIHQLLKEQQSREIRSTVVFS
ncbi:MAG: DUF5685 family protein, partial [Saprospiraceae bacterium]|nr:DUF5685 family protein [Saprospiraceae bacterium]